MKPPEDVHVTYQLQYRKCGKKICKCHTPNSDYRHGPYWYGYWRDHQQVLHSAYVGKEKRDLQEAA